VPLPRRFPPPWSVEETAPCFIVRDANGQALAFAYCEDEPGHRATGKLLTRDEARRIAANIAKLPELTGSHGSLQPQIFREHQATLGSTGNSPPKMLGSNLSIYTLESD
jgi:hypothetical protein